MSDNQNQILQDPEFGPMRFDGSDWILERTVRFNGTDVSVHIEPEDEVAHTLSPVQRAAVRAALTLPPDVLEQSAPVVVQNYEVYREMLGDDELPPLPSPVDVWQTVEPAYIAVGPHGDQTVPTFLLFAECGWDPEHGLEVRFRDGRADASGQQGELGDE